MSQIVFTSKKIRTVEIPNRFVVPAMVLNYCREDGYPTERYLAYHEARARGGWGLIITEDYAIEPRGKGYSNIPGFWEDGHVEAHAQLPQRVHRYGSRIFAQIYHAGRQTNSSIMGLSPVAPSPIPCPTKKQMPHALSRLEIQELVAKFGRAALMARQAGFDGVEIHGAHGYLVAGFLSAYSNKRTDEYGGTITNRARFALEIVRTMRRMAGNDFPIIFRISGDEFVPGGRTIEETKALCMLLEAAGVDAFHVSAGVYGSRHRVVPPARMSHGHIVDHAAEVRSVVDVPVITVGWINDPLMAEAILRSQKADFVAMGRASLADPELPNKTAAGQLEEIIHCIGCMQGCTEKIRQQGQAGGCMLNPLTGHETDLQITRADATRSVTVVGGGIAGMEAAIVAARRGHSVTLYERSAHLGGQYALATVAPGKGEIASFINWQTQQLQQLGVRILTNREFTVTDGKSSGAETIILASGSVPNAPPFPGVDNPRVVRALDVLSGSAEVGASALLIGGGMVGAETANHLAAHEKQVTIVELLPEIALDEEVNSRQLLLNDLEEHRVEVWTATKVVSIEEDFVRVASGNSERVIGPFDTIVLALGSVADDRLEKELEEAGIPCTVIGDAKDVRKALEAIDEGYRAGLSV